MIPAILALIGALVSAQDYAREHQIDAIEYMATIGECRVMVWTNGNPQARPLRDFVWVAMSVDDDPRCWDIGDRVQRDVTENNR